MKIIIREFLNLLNQIKAQDFYIYTKLIEIIIINKDKDLTIIAF